MQQLTIEKSNILKFQQKLISEYTVIGPVEHDGMILFEQVHDPQKIRLSYDTSNKSPKSVCFPQTETLFAFSKENKIRLQSPQEDHETVIFGVHPCDARALHILDKVFDGDYKDTLYLEKRKKTVIIGLTCLSPPLNCFCTSVGGRCDDTTGLDILLTDCGDTFFVDVVTSRGERIIQSSSYFKPASTDDIKLKENLCTQANQSIQRHMNTENIGEILETIRETTYWEDIARRCLGCGICTFLCPTCHCFDIQDETKGNRGARIRVWDSCMYPEYTCQASGYNPRPFQMNRVRNRVFHKFNYFPKNYAVIGCVGCGRCITFCPVNIDIIEIINKAREVKS
jgi:sulfhydrogenase subunit beta (sulfur reductase)